MTLSLMNSLFIIVRMLAPKIRFLLSDKKVLCSLHHHCHAFYERIVGRGE